MKIVSTLLLGLAFLTACQKEETATDLYGAGAFMANEGTFEGCIQGYSVDRQSVKVIYQAPIEATEFKILRDGNLVSSVYPSKNGFSGEFQDQNLREGGVYKYTCQAKIRGVYKRGTKELVLKPVNTFAPKFEGINKVELVGKTSARVEWEPAREDGPIAKYYQVYISPGRGIPFNANPIKIEGKFSTLIERLGDQLPYNFAVRACTVNNICDDNNVTRDLETADSGAPKTVGITEVYGKVGKRLVVIAPWSHEQGGVFNRKLIVVRAQPNETSSSAEERLKNCSIESESANCEYHNFSYNNGIVTTSELELPIEENNTYFIRLIDEDQFQNRKLHTDIKRFESSDLTAPAFNGIITLSQPDPMKDTLRATFQAPTDATTVHLYTVSGKIGESLQNPCELEGLGEKILSPDWKGNISQRYIEFESNQRTQVRVCLKLSDAAGNLSETNIFRTINTKDRQAPQFLGISGINITNGKINVTWSQATSTQNDIKEYQLRITVARGTQRLNYNISSQTGNGTSLDIGSTGLALEDYDTLFAAVNVCDDAFEKQVSAVSGSNNCSDYVIDEANSTNGKNKLALGIIKTPQKFDGISQVTSNGHGSITVKWGRYDSNKAIPTSWAGFNIYSIKKDGAEVLLETIACPITAEDSEKRPIYNCEDSREKVISGLTPYAQLRILVRAFNSQGESKDIGQDKALMVRVQDLMAPVLSGTISSIELDRSLKLSWNAALDTQSFFTDFDQTTASRIFYVIRQNGSVISTQELREIAIDLKKLRIGLNTFQVCATDESSNTTPTCLSTTYNIGDKIPPLLKIADLKRIGHSIELKLDLRDETTAQNTLCNNVSVENSGATISKNFESSSNLCVVTGITGAAASDQEHVITLRTRDDANNSGFIDVTVKTDRLYKISSAKWGNWENSGVKRFALVIAGENIIQGSSVDVDGVNLTCEQPDKLKMICFANSIPRGEYRITSPGVAYDLTSKINRSFSSCQYSLGSVTNGNGFSRQTIRICNLQDWESLRSMLSSTNSGINPLRNNNRILTVQLGNHIQLNSLAPINPSATQATLVLDGDGYMIGGGDLIRSNVSNLITGGLFGNLGSTLEFKVIDLGIYSLEMRAPTESDFTGGHVYMGAIVGFLCSNKSSFENVWIDGYRYIDTEVKSPSANRIWKFGSLFGTICSGTSTLAKEIVFKNIQVTRLNMQLPDFNSSSTITLGACAIGCGGTSLNPDSWITEGVQLSGKIKNIKGFITGGFESINLSESSIFKNFQSSLDLEGLGISGIATSIGNSSPTQIENLVLANKITTTGPSDTTGFSAFSLNSDLMIKNSIIRNQFSASAGKIYGIINTTGYSWAGNNPLCGNNPLITFSNVDFKSTFLKTGANVEAYSVGRLTRPVRIKFEEVNLEDIHDSDRVDLNFINPVRSSSHCGTYDTSIEMNNVFVNLINQRMANGEVINSNTSSGEAWMKDFFTRPFLKSSLEKLGVIQVD